MLKYVVSFPSQTWGGGGSLVSPRVHCLSSSVEQSLYHCLYRLHSLSLCAILLSHSLNKRNLSFEFLRFIFFFFHPYHLCPSFSFKEKNGYIVLILCDWLNYKLLKQGSCNSSCYLGKISLLPQNKCLFVFLYCQMFLFWKETFNIFLCPTRVEETRYFRILTRLGPQICGTYSFKKSIITVLHLIFPSSLKINKEEKKMGELGSIPAVLKSNFH